MTDYPIVIMPISEEDGGGYMAAFPDLPGCLSDGETLEEALANASDAFRAWMEAQIERKAEIPEPGSSARRLQVHVRSMAQALVASLDYADSADMRIEALELALERAVSDLGSGWAGSRLTLASVKQAKLLGTCH